MKLEGEFDFSILLNYGAFGGRDCAGDFTMFKF